MRRNFDILTRTCAASAVVAAWVAVIGGCGQPTVVTELPPETQNLRTVVMAYQQAASDLARAPSSMDELRPYVAEYGDVDRILTSPNDGKPYVVVWNIDLAKVRRGQMPMVAHEQSGSNGSRLAIDYQMRVSTLSGQ